MYCLLASSLLAFVKRYSGWENSFERGNLPNEVCACFESRVLARAVSPIMIDGQRVCFKSGGRGLLSATYLQT